MSVRTQPRRLVALMVVVLFAISIELLFEHGTGRSAAPAPELVSVRVPTSDPNDVTPFGATNVSPAISGDGRFVVFDASSRFSESSDTAAVRDRLTRTSSLVPLADGVEWTEGSTISRDGCHIALWGWTIVSLDPVAYHAVPYIWDRCAGTRVVPAETDSAVAWPFGASSTLANLAISDDGRFVAFAGTTGDGAPYVVGVIDTVTHTRELLPARPANHAVLTVDISGDGAVVAFDGTPTRGGSSSLVQTWSPATGAVEAVSVAPSGAAAVGTSAMPSLSHDGRFVAFVSNSRDIAGVTAPTLQLYVRDRTTATTRLVTATPGQPLTTNAVQPDITPDASQVAFGTIELPAIRGAVRRAGVIAARSTSGVFETAAFTLISADAPTVEAGLGPQPVVSTTGRAIAFASADGSTFTGDPRFLTTFQVWLVDRPPQVTVASSVDLGTVDVGATSSPVAVLVTNSSDVGVQLDAVGRPAAPFAVAGDGCSGVLLVPGGSCTVTVTLTPTAGGAAASSLVVTGEGQSATVALTGTGRVRTRGLAANPTSVTFPATPVGTTTAPIAVTITDTGDLPATIASSSLGGARTDQFRITSSTCESVTLSPGSTCTVSVVAAPTVGGASAAVIAVRGTNGEAIDVAVSVTGVVSVATTVPPSPPSTTTSVASDPPTPGALVIDPPTVSFPPTVVGTPSTPVTVTVTNTGGSAVAIGPSSLGGDGADQFTIVADTCAAVRLPPLASCTVTLVASPTRGGPQTAQFVVSGAAGESAASTLTVDSTFAPLIAVTPGVVRPGDIATVAGVGFPPDRVVELQFTAVDGGAPIVPIGRVTTDATGAFRMPVLLRRDGLPSGGRLVVVVDQADITAVRAPLLIDQGTARPSGSFGGSIVTGVVSIIGRNG